MLDLRPVFFIIGILIAAFGGIMIIPGIVDAASGEAEWKAFALSSLLTVFVGGALILTNRIESMSLNLRQAFLFTGLAWFSIALFGALPFALSDFGLSPVDAFFESVSGITTTGSTVISGLDKAPPGILLWRSMMQWLGGIGIIVFALAFLPILRVGGMQLFKTEAFDTPEKVLPGAAQIALSVGGAYVLLTSIIMFALTLAGMPAFDALNHAMTSISTGGFSTKDASVGHFGNMGIDWIITTAMIIGGMPFVHLVAMLRGSWRPLLRDSQVHWYLTILLLAMLSVTAWLWLVDEMPVAVSVTQASFNVASVMTGTGYATADFNRWGGLPLIIMLMLMFIGGCAGSTACGIKVFRFQVAYAIARIQIARLLQPHGVFVANYNRRPITEEIAGSVMGFFFLFVASFAVLAGILGLSGLDFITAISGAATAISNVGPGLGQVIGPEGNFSSLPDGAKLALTGGMLLGRLELYTILILFTAGFWRG